jgi:ribonuclease M5
MERACAHPLAPPPLRPPPRRAACRARFATRAAASSSSKAAPAAPPRASFVRPALRELVVVEGERDADAVRQAVTADVAVTHGTPPAADRTLPYAVPPRALAALLAAADKQRGVIIFADPDPGGRAMRAAMEALLSPRGDVAHAFLPQAQCRCRGGAREGAVGVQFARPAAVRAALASARRRDAARDEFTRDDLTAWGLAGVHGAPPPAGYAASGGVAARRDAVGAALGFGPCDGKVFLKYVNAYGFTRQQLQDAVAALDEAAAAAEAAEAAEAAGGGEDEA